MMAQTFKVEGLSELEAALKGLREEFDLSRTTAKNIVKRALMKAADPIESDAAARAPVLTGVLQRSVSTGTKLSRRQKGLHHKESEVEIFVGAGALAQATAQEFGTSHNAPQPFLRPAWDSNKMAALDSIKETLGTEIEKATKRLAKKAQREALKLKAGL